MWRFRFFVKFFFGTIYVFVTWSSLSEGQDPPLNRRVEPCFASVPGPRVRLIPKIPFPTFLFFFPLFLLTLEAFNFRILFSFHFLFPSNTHINNFSFSFFHWERIRSHFTSYHLLSPSLFPTQNPNLAFLHLYSPSSPPN